jgi:60 kDa SS-A/Ro ribonucleoprotein
MTKYGKLYNPNTPQNQPMEAGQVKNNAGGYVFQVTPWVRLGRFLQLGSENPTYYQHAPALTKENAKCVIECWNTDPRHTAETICEISDAGRAPKNDPAIFALALGAINSNKEARQEAHAAVQAVCRTASYLFQWQNDCGGVGKGSGRGYKRVLANWYGGMDTSDLAFQMVKYRQRAGYTHKRAIELSNQGPQSCEEDRINLYKWARGKEVSGKLPAIVEAHIEAMTLEPKDSKRLIELITAHKLPWEAIPTWALTSKEVWEALIPTVGLTALIRNLGNITAAGALTGDNYKEVTKRLLNEKALDKARIHPFNVLQALAIYRSGQGMRGNKTWTPVTKVTDALNEAFYKCFKYAGVTGKKILIGLDVSGSMTAPIGAPKVDMHGSWTRARLTSGEKPNPLSCREAAAAMCLVLLKNEPNIDIIGFTHGEIKTGTSARTRWDAPHKRMGVMPLDITPSRRLDDVVDYTGRQHFDATDCSLPMRWALNEKKTYDAIVIYTDNETWSGHVHPKEALLEYRRKMGVDTKLIVCAMTSTGFSIADPNDGGMLDICGIDSAVPALISNFMKH